MLSAAWRPAATIATNKYVAALMIGTRQVSACHANRFAMLDR
jgi:hypothetical protein